MMGMFTVQSPADDTSLPALEMLEFLADWETEDGQWIDPVELDEVSVAQLPANENIEPGGDE